MNHADVAPYPDRAIRAERIVDPRRMSNQPAHSDELDDGIQDALSQLNVSITEAKHHNDPLWMPLSALSAFLRSMQRLHTNFVGSMRKSIEEAKQPVRDDELRRAVAQGILIHAGQLAQCLWVRTVLIVAGMLLVTLACGIGAGYWFRGAAPIMAGLTGGATQCDDKPDGSRLCW